MQRRHGDWREATFELAVELAEAKKSLRNNIKAFGSGAPNDLATTGFPIKTALRSFAGVRIQKEREPCLSNEIKQVNSAGSTPELLGLVDAHRPPSPKRDQVKAFIHAYKAEHGVNPPYALVEEETGVSNNVVIRAFGEVKLEAEPKLTKGQNYDVEARIKVRMRELEKEFEARVTVRNKEDIDKAFPRLQELQDKAALERKTLPRAIAKNSCFQEK